MNRTSLFDNAEYKVEFAKLAEFKSKLSGLNSRLFNARADWSKATEADAESFAILEGKAFNQTDLEDVPSLERQTEVWSKVVGLQEQKVNRLASAASLDIMRNKKPEYEKLVKTVYERAADLVKAEAEAQSWIDEKISGGLKLSVLQRVNTLLPADRLEAFAEAAKHDIGLDLTKGTK